MSNNQQGFAFHCHHDMLFEYVCDYEVRLLFIDTMKPVTERQLRRRLFKLIPSDRLPEELRKAAAVVEKTWANKEKALTNYETKSGAAFEKLLTDYKKALDAYERAMAAYVKVHTKHMTELEALHTELCPDCPWDGQTIFTRRDEHGVWY